MNSVFDTNMLSSYRAKHYFPSRLLVDYRWFDANSIDPRYEFGFGLSYTTFEYSNLKIFKLFCEEDGPEKEWAKGNVKQNGVGSSLASWYVGASWASYLLICLSIFQVASYNLLR